jgi:predicted ribosome quality control (RQC) complex YloA/Tae2 family protein
MLNKNWLLISRHIDFITGTQMKVTTSPNGFPVYCGADCVENERLTFQLATPWDMWFHVKGVPGAHVVLTSVRHKDKVWSPEDIMFAATIAAQNSKCKGTGKGKAKNKMEKKTTVEYCLVSDVTKPPKAHKGSVLVRNSELICVAMASGL